MICRALKSGFLSSLCFGTALAAQSADEITILKGQQKFLGASIQLCRERVPALDGELSSAYDHAEREIRKAERLIVEATAATIKSDQRYLDQYSDMWSKSADQLIEALKKQSAPQACPTLVGNWQALEAATIIEDWENFFDRYSAEAEEPVAPSPSPEAK